MNLGPASVWQNNVPRVIALWVAAGLVFAQRPGARGARFFDTRVEPILRDHCLSCHNDRLKDGGVSFLDRGRLLKGGRRGPTIVPGKPDESILIQAVRQDGELTMPPGGKLSQRDIATLTKWIKRGAPWGTNVSTLRSSGN